MQARLILIITVLFFAMSSAAIAQQSCEDSCCYKPRIKFLGDLFHNGCNASESNPYEERIETDRHDFTQSTKTVGRGITQVEAGYSYYYKDENNEVESSHATPEMLLRMGLSENIEFRLRWNYAWRFIDEGDNEDSAQDLNWAIKLGISDQECWRPKSALEIRSSIPTGGADWTTGRVEFGLDYIYRWKLSEEVALYGSSGFGTDGLVLRQHKEQG